MSRIPDSSSTPARRLTLGVAAARRARGRVAIACAGLLVASAALPTSALAHGLVGKQDLPIPRWLFAWAAAIVLVASFVALGTLWVSPRWQRGVPSRDC